MSSSTDALTVVRAHFDEVLADHVRKIVDAEDLPPGFTLDIASIASLVLFAEREDEVRQFPEAPPEFYTKDSFLFDIQEIGLGSDPALILSLDSLLEAGFVVELGSEELRADESAQKMLQVINTLFPGMQGINLVAYIVQTIDEVVTGRKDIYEAKNNFLQTLNIHSLAGQFQELSKEKESESKKGSFVVRSKKTVSPEWNKSVLQRLKRLRSEKLTFRTEEMQVREIFVTEEKEKPVFKEDSAEKTEPLEEAAVEETEPLEEAAAEETESLEELAAEETEPLEELAVEETEPLEELAVEETEPLEEPAAEETEPLEELAAEEIEPLEEAAAEETEPLEEPTAEEEPLKEELIEEAAAVEDDEIEARIAAFEENLALTCPLCKTGKLQLHQTEKGKSFYDCSLSSCHFISWSQPFPYTCPVCANPFLVAFTTKEGKEGLRCPKATCNYSQDLRVNPEEYQLKKKKKRKVVRRVRRKA